MNNKKIKKSLAVFFGINIALLGAYGYLFYVVESKNKETAALYIASHQQASDKEKILGLERALKDAEGDRSNLSKYFVTKTSPVTFIEQIEKIGKNSGVVLSVNSVSDNVKDVNGIQINFSATGEFSNMYHLIALIESMPYRVTLGKADIQKAENRTTAGIGEWSGSFVVTLEGFASSNVASAQNVNR